MNFYDKKSRKIIIVILVIAMVVPMLSYALS